jgi:hypothetical protein
VGDASESLGSVTTNEDGNGHFKVDTEKGDPIPFGAGDLAALEGYGVSVKNDAGAVVLAGTICPAQPRPDDDDDDDDDDDHPPPVHPRCFTAALDGAQEVPAVDTQATGKGEFHLGRRDGTVLHYEVEATGLSGPATAAHIHAGAAGVAGDVLITLDHATLKGEIELTPEQIAALTTGETYVNVHTEANSGGEVRGQLTVCADDDDDGDDDGHDGMGDDGAAGGGGAEPDVEEPMFLMTGEFDAPFLRGDANHDASVDISDAVATLSYLFTGGSRPYCLDAADTNDDGSLDISDPIGTLRYLFLAGDAPSSPGTLIPGSDTTADGLYCEEPQA